MCDLSDRAVEPVFQVAGPAPRERSALPASTAIGFVLAREGSRLLARGPTERFALEIGRRFDARPTTPPSHVVALVCPDRTVVLADLRERSLTPLELPREHWTAFFVANGRVVAQRGGEAVATELDGAQRQEGPARMRASGPAAGALSQDGSLFAMVDHLFVRVFDPRRSSLSSWFQTGGDVRERPEVPARVRFADGGRSLLVLWPDRAARFSVLGSDIVERHEPTATVVRASPDGSRVALCVPTRPRQPDRLVLSTLRRIRRDRFGTRRTVELGDGACSDPQLVWMSPHVIWVVWGGLDVVAADSDVAERRAVISLHSHGGQLVVREGDAAIAQLEDAPRARARLAGSALRWHQLGDTRAICDRPVRRPPSP